MIPPPVSRHRWRSWTITRTWPATTVPGRSWATPSTVTVFTDHVADEESLVDRLAGFPVVVAMRERTAFPRRVLQRLSDLRLLVTTGMGNAAIDLVAARDHGVVVTGTGGLGPPTAELTWALILGLARDIVHEDQGIRAGGWQRSVGADLAGATLGVVGLGRLGSRVADIGLAFGMDVIAWSQNLQSATAQARGVRAVSKDELFRTADVVTIHLQLSERTRGLITKDDLALLKPTATIVNTSRGPIIDEGRVARGPFERAAGRGRPGRL
jgi:phosphoglycerate dehydrogenase-like enzyme